MKGESSMSERVKKVIGVTFAVVAILFLSGIFDREFYYESTYYNKECLTGEKLIGATVSEAGVYIKKDGISVNKTASLTTYNGQRQDSEGNPYIKVDFEVDKTGTGNRSAMTISGTTDIVLTLGLNDDMGNYAEQIKEAAKTFINDVFVYDRYTQVSNKIRVAIVQYDSSSRVVHSLSSDRDSLISAIDSLSAGVGNNIQAGIYETQNILRTSFASSKVMVLLSDGHANAHIEETGSDIASADYVWGTGADYTEEYWNRYVCTEQTRIMDSLVSGGVTSYAIGTNGIYNDLLYYSVSTDSNNNKLMYYAYMGQGFYTRLENAFLNVRNNLYKNMGANPNPEKVLNQLKSIVDLIPQEFTVMEDTITSVGNQVSGSVSADKSQVIWEYQNVDYIEKIQNLSYVMKLDISMIPQDVYQIWTNGTTTDINQNSFKSTLITYETGTFELMSPKIALPGRERTESRMMSHCVNNDANVIYGIDVLKFASWTSIDGSYEDSDGNPYVKIEFTLNRNMVNDHEVNSLVDIIPPEYTVMEDTIYTDNANLTSQISADGRNITWDFAIPFIEEEVKCGFIMKLEKSRLSRAYFDKTLDVLTNGTTIDIDQNMEGCAVLTYDTNQTVKLESPYLTVDFNAWDIPYPDEENKQMGDEITEALTSDGISVKKTAEWAKYYSETVDSAGNPYVRVTYEVQDTSSGGTTIGRINSLVDLIPPEYTVMEDTIACDSSMVTSQISADGRKITWNYKEGVLDRDIQMMSFVMKLNKNSLTREYLLQTSQVYTNGTTIDVNQDSLNSSQLTYETTRTLPLYSPKLTVPFTADEIAVPDSVAIDENDGILVKKTAEWTTYNGESVDSAGNPFVKVDFVVKEIGSSADDTGSGGSGKKTADIVLALDTSDSMDMYNKLLYMRQAAISFVNGVLDYTNIDVRIAIVGFNINARLWHDFSSDKDSLSTTLQQISTNSGTNIQAGIYEAQKLLQASSADMKYLVLMTDGVAVNSMTETGDGIAEIGADYIEGQTDRDIYLTDKQAELIKELIPNLSFYAVGFEDEMDMGYLEQSTAHLASIDSSGRRLYYDATVDSDGLLSDIGDVFSGIKDEIVTDMDNEYQGTTAIMNKPSSLIDYIPSEYMVMEDTITCDSSMVTSEISADGRKITWNYQDGDLEKNVQNMSFIMKLEKYSLSKEYLQKTLEVWTNGRTTDVNESSAASAIVKYGKDGDIYLESPKLTVPFTADDLADSTVVVSQDGITVTKSVSSTTVDGNTEDSDGNPYVKVDFEVTDTTITDTDATRINSLVDLIPPEYTVLESSITSDSSMVSAELSADCSRITWTYKAGEIGSSIQKMSYIMKLSKQSFTREYLERTSKVWSNGATANIFQSSAKSSWVTYETDKTLELGSPTFTLPFTAYDINEAVVQVSKGGITVKKSVSWAAYNGQPRDSDNNPYIKVNFEVKRSNNYLTNYDKYGAEIEDGGVNRTNRPHSLVDLIPDQCTILEDSITQDNPMVSPEVSADKRMITWNYADGELVERIQNMSFIMVLDMDKLAASGLKKAKKVYTNGKTMDTKKSSDRSSWVVYGAGEIKDVNNEKIDLWSPKLDIDPAPDPDEPLVVGSKDGITLKKSVSWTTYNGETKDSEGNPYVEVNFEIKEDLVKNTSSSNTATTEPPTSQLSGKNSADVVLVLDNSNSMQFGTRLSKMKEAAKNVINKLLASVSTEVRVAVVSFGDSAEVVQSLSSDRSSIANRIENSFLGDETYTNIQAGIYEAQKILKASSADLKYVMLLSDGEAGNGILDAKGDSSIAQLDENEIDNENAFSILAEKQADIMKKEIPNVVLYTVGLYSSDCEDYEGGFGERLLLPMASTDITGKKLYYNAMDESNGVVKDIGQVFNEIKDNIVTDIVTDLDYSQVSGSGELVILNKPSNLVDLIPAECTVIESSITSDNSSVKSQISADKRRVTWSYQAGKLDTNIQNMSLVMTVDKDSLTEDKLQGATRIWTNGTTIDINQSSAKSSWILYGKGNTIELKSPMLKVPTQPSLTTPSNDDSVVVVTKDGITVKKSASKTTYNGETEDSEGNPYVKVDFEVMEDNIEENIEEVSIRSRADIVLVLDVSGSMKNKGKINYMKQAAVDFASGVLNYTDVDVRVAVITFEKNAKITHPLSPDIDSIYNAIQKVKPNGGTNIQGAIYEAQKLLQESAADMKYMVLMSDGEATASMTKTGPGVACVGKDFIRGQTNKHIYLANKQAEIIKNLIPELLLYTIGYENSVNEQNLESTMARLASEDSANRRLYFSAAVDGEGELRALRHIFYNIRDRILADIKYRAKLQMPTSLVDLIPPQYTVLEDTITVDNSMITSQISTDKRRIIWNYPSSGLDTKVQKMSFVMKLHMDSLTDEYLESESQVWTNGETIDVSQSSAKSSWLTYGAGKLIELTSPKFTLTNPNEHMLNEDPEPDPDSIIEIITGEDFSTYKLFYTYYMNNKYIRGDEIKFKVTARQSNALFTEIFFKILNTDGSDEIKLDDSLITVVDSEGEKLECNAESKGYKVEFDKVYTAVLNKGESLDEFLEKQSDSFIHISGINSTEPAKMRLKKRECFEQE